MSRHCNSLAYSIALFYIDLENSMGPLIRDMVLLCILLVADVEKVAAIRGSSAQKELTLQKDYANSNKILLEMCRKVLSKKDFGCWETKFLLYDDMMIAILHDTFFIPCIPQEICRRILIAELRCPEG
jgi:hypothetical protein